MRLMTEDEPIVGDDWLGTPDAAKYLGLAPQTLYRLIDEGRLPAYRMGRVIRIKVSDSTRSSPHARSSRARSRTCIHRTTSTTSVNQFGLARSRLGIGESTPLLSLG